MLEDELQQLLKLVQSYDMTIGAVRTSAERTFQSALALGLTVTLESADGAPVADAAPAVTNVTTAAYFVYRGYLRSGHRLRRKEHVLVIGDVNPGAEVFSDGDILVWGRLRGVAHAGANGNRRAIVAALDLSLHSCASPMSPPLARTRRWASQANGFGNARAQNALRSHELSIKSFCWTSGTPPVPAAWSACAAGRRCLVK